MKKQLNQIGTLSLGKELKKNELKQIKGGIGSLQTYCDGNNGPFVMPDPFPVPGSTAIGCQPTYCKSAGHGNFLYCDQ